MRWLLVSVYAVALVAATLVPWGPPVARVSRIDTALHLAAWAALAFLATLAVRGGVRPLLAAAAAAAGASIALGALVEALQPLTGRTAEVSDLAADAFGAALGATAAAALTWHARRVQRRRGGTG